MTRPLAIRTLLVILVTASVVALATPAGAHNDTATMGIEVTPGTEPLTAKVRVLLEYTSDGDVAPGALVVAEATGPDGATVAPTPLTDVGEGNYEAVVAMPSEGSWMVTVTATNPAAVASAGIGLAPVTVVPDTPTSSDPDVDISADAVRRTEPTSSDDGPSPALVAVIAVAVVAALGATVVVVRRRRSVIPPGS